MTGRVARSLLLSATGLFCLSSLTALAETQKPAPEAEKTPTAANSLKSVLQQAGEKGLLRLDDKKVASLVPEDTQDSPKVQSALNVTVDCAISHLFDFSDYVDVKTYDVILETKSSIASAKSAADIEKLAKQYLALGFGAEVTALASPYETEDAKLMQTLGRIVDGIAESEDIALVTQYKSCSDLSAFWSQVAQASHAFSDDQNEGWGLSMNQRQILLDMPEHIKAVLVTRLGIHAAELEQKTLADQLLSLIEPQSRRGLLPKIKDDDRLYYYALVRQLKGDPVSSRILEHLGREDGVYQTRALLKLVKHRGHADGHEYDEFSSALLSVQQQYRGSAPSRKATLEVVKHQVEDRHYIYAIDLSKNEFSATDVEMQGAINVIGNHLNSDFTSDNSHQQLSALNGYLYDTDFFRAFEHVEDLKSHAYESALHLNLPELALKIPAKTISASKDLVFTRQLADAQIAYKKGEYEKVVELSKPHLENERYRDLLLKASRKIDSQLTQAKVADTVPDGVEKYKFEADIALQNSRWDVAQSALKALSETEKSDTGTEETLAIVKYVAQDDEAQLRNASSDRVEDIETFNKKIEADISLVKAYLKNG